MFLHQGMVEEEGAPADVFGAPKSERFKQFISSHRCLFGEIGSGC